MYHTYRYICVSLIYVYTSSTTRHVPEGHAMAAVKSSIYTYTYLHYIYIHV